MKTKIKRHSRAVLSIVLTLCMIVSCMTVGMIATDAAKTADERVGAADDGERVGAADDGESVGAVDDSESVGAISQISLRGTFNNWSSTEHTATSFPASWDISLTANTEYQFKVVFVENGNHNCGITENNDGTYNVSDLGSEKRLYWDKGGNVHFTPTTTGTYTFKVTSNNMKNYITITKKAETTYPVSVTAGTGGTVASASVNAGATTPVKLPTATPKPGYDFNEWTASSPAAISSGSTSADNGYVTATGTGGSVAASFTLKANMYLSGWINGSAKNVADAEYKFTKNSDTNYTKSFTATGACYVTLNDGTTVYHPSSNNSPSGSEVDPSKTSGYNDDPKWFINVSDGDTVTVTWNPSTQKLSWTVYTPDVSGLEKLYVLDGIVTRKNNAIQDYGTNTFGDTKIISANSGVLSYDYYDATGSDQFVNTDNVNSEGQTMYHYDPATDLDFRVQTTIKSGHQAIGVRAYVMNGMTYPAKKDKDGNYYADITLDANSGEGTLEVIPVYYNKLIEANGDYIKFYVDANTIGNKFGKTIGYSIWYKDTSLHGETGDYPGQPLMSDGSLLYGYFPKYYVSNNATELPSADSRSAFAGVLLSNLAEHNETHKNVLKDWGCDTGNYQSFDYEDPVEIAKIANVDTIEFVAKYKTLNTAHRYDSNLNRRDLNGVTGKSWPASITRPSSASDALNNGFEYLTNIDGKRVNIFNENDKTLTGDPLYVVSVGNQQVSPNEWDTVWEVYTTDGQSIAAARPVDFIDSSSSLQTALASYTNSPVLINYEGWLAGESNTGTRLDGRWLYSKSTDDTTLRLRVATKDNSGNLTFMTNGISWAEISDGTSNGSLEAADTSNLTKILELNDRTTEVTAKINPVGYKVEGMYMLSASYSDTADNGYSSKITDYDNLDVSGTATSFINSKDNRMVIVVEEIEATNLMITHQMYGGPGAHKIKGFYYLRAELLDSNDNVIETYNNSTTGTSAYTNKDIEIQNFTTNAPKGEGYKLKIYVRTVMSGSATFFQWYENNHNNGYNELDSDSARGSNSPVVYEKTVNVDDLYGNLESNLSIRNLDYYSDLQSSESININHLLTSKTVSDKLDGTTYTKVTVVDSSGNAVRGGSYDIKAKTTVVDSSFITSDAADAGNQIKVEIWTVPKLPAAFDSFYRTDTVKLVDGAFGGIAYTSEGETITYNSKEYPKATVMIPISYFFKSSTDDQGNPIEIFDSAKKDFNVYSALKQFGKYTIEFNYTSRLYDDQTYVVKGDITEDLMKYFDFTNKQLVEDNKQELIDIMAPKEDNFMKTITWSKANISYFAYLNGEFTVRIEASQVNAVTLNCKFNLPYAHTFGMDELTIPDNTKDSAGRPYYVPQVDNDFSAKYMNHYTLDNSGTSNQFITAAPEIYDTGNQKVKYFQYWNVYRVGGPYKDENVIRKCYFNAFNLTFYEAYRIEAVYGDTKPASPSSVSYNDGIKASISWLDNSRNQWNAGHGGSVATVENKAYWKYRGDRVFSDFALSFSYNDLKLKESSDNNIKTYFVIEQLDELENKTVDGKTVKDIDNIIYPSDDGKTAVQNSIKGAAQIGKKYIKKEIAKSDLDNKNCIEYYYNFANRKQENIIDPDGKILLSDYTTMRNYLYRAYAVIYDGTTAVASDPAYFTIYDIASIENYQQKNYSQN